MQQNYHCDESLNSQFLSVKSEDATPMSSPKEAMSLTEYAVLSRYPGDLEPVTEKEYKESVELAKKVVQWAERLLAKAS